MLSSKNAEDSKEQKKLYEHYILDTAAVVHSNDLKGRIFTSMPAPQEVASNTSEPIDGNFELRNSFSFCHCA
jgi:hypothetical protein